MICPKCKEAGAILTETKNDPDYGISEIASLHKQCEAPTTCSCQHYLGPDALRK